METSIGPRRKNSVCAVVLNYLNYDQTILCVRDLLAQDHPELEVIIVDNHSPNESFARLQEAFADESRVTAIQTHDNLGYAGGNNHAARWRLEHGAVDFLLIINNDVRLPDRETVRRLAEFAGDKGDLGGVGPAVVTRNGFPQGPYRRPRAALRTLRNLFPIFPLVFRFWRRANKEKKAGPCYAIVGAFMLLKAEAFARAGLFDEQTFLGAEEYILAERFRRIDLRFYHYPLVTVIHNHQEGAIVRSGGEGRHFPSGLASMLHYFREYQGANGLSLRLYEVSAQLYSRVFLPIRRRFTI